MSFSRNSEKIPIEFADDSNGTRLGLVSRSTGHQSIYILDAFIGGI